MLRCCTAPAEHTGVLPRAPLFIRPIRTEPYPGSHTGESVVTYSAPSWQPSASCPSCPPVSLLPSSRPIAISPPAPPSAISPVSAPLAPSPASRLSASPTGIQLNAISLVNLAMALGIAVEFCAHVLHAYGVAPGGLDRAGRVAAALAKSGASVVSGITLTKLVGVAVLAAAQTQIFEVYYFRSGMEDGKGTRPRDGLHCKFFHLHADTRIHGACWRPTLCSWTCTTPACLPACVVHSLCGHPGAHATVCR